MITGWRSTAALASTVATEVANLALTQIHAQIEQSLKAPQHGVNFVSTPVQNPVAQRAVPPPIPLDARLPSTGIEAPDPIQPMLTP